MMGFRGESLSEPLNLAQAKQSSTTITNLIKKLPKEPTRRMIYRLDAIFDLWS